MFGVGLVLLSTLGFAWITTLTQLAFNAGMNIPTALAIRFALAAVFGWLILLVRRQGGLERRRLGGLLLLVLTYVGSTATFFLSVRLAPASIAAIGYYVYPVIVTILSIIFLHERLTWLRGAALGLALVGSALTVGTTMSGLSEAGILLAFASAALYAIYIVVSSRVVRGMSIGVSMAWIMTGLAVIYGIFGAMTNTLDFRFEPWGWLVILAMALLATFLPLQLFLAGILRIGPSRAAIIATIEPVLAVVLAAVILRERIGPFQILGGLLILVAVVLLQLQALKRGTQPGPTVPGPSSSTL